jgi:formylglycine-generating enzyme required for sulfatase activity
MRRLILISLAALVLLLIGGAVWTGVGVAPVHLVWRYGFSYGPESTGRVLTVSGVEFVEIGPGCFRMGSNEIAEGGDILGRCCARFGLPWGDQPEPSNEMPAHWVEFRRGFWMAKTEVTNAQYEAFDPEHERGEDSSGPREPVVAISWEEATKYCAQLSEMSGLPIRLPSESEWECACRAGSRWEFTFGEGESRLGTYAWYQANSGGRAHEVGTRRANVWGLHDFHGNVWEWCEDTYHPNHENAPADGTVWTRGGPEWKPDTPFRVVRGGAFDCFPAYVRSAVRGWGEPVYRFAYLGFRPAFSPPAR